MGYVLFGPVGTGKIYLATSSAGDLGITAVALKNFRSMWQAETEANLQRVLALVQG
jgi:transitional endoplasmic reticulum ATPase